MRVSDAIGTFFRDELCWEAEQERAALLRHLREKVTPSEWRMEFDAAMTRQAKQRADRGVQRAIKERVRHRRRPSGGSGRLRLALADTLVPVLAAEGVEVSEHRLAKALALQIRDWGYSAIRQALPALRDSPHYDTNRRKWQFNREVA